jgi:DNA-binding XRE family transcriptional regulator
MGDWKSVLKADPVGWLLEKGKYNPSLMLVHQIAKALKTTIDELFLFEDE